MMKDTAIIILAYSDYESLELALASHGKVIDENNGNVPKIYILLNGSRSESYECSRTILTAERYVNLYPNNIECIYQYNGRPYHSIDNLIKSDKFEKYKYIIKLDDDVLVLTNDWFTQLFDTYKKGKELYKENFAYSTSLVNNNPWGFKEVIRIMNLEDEYFSDIARPHFVGLAKDDAYSPYKIAGKNEIITGGGGTIWRNAYIARWVHEKTTLNPYEFIAATKNEGTKELNTKERYSINCLFFEKELWHEIGENENSDDDEFLLQKYCIKNKMHAIANLQIPMCHLFFYTQKFENRDLFNEFVQTYTDYLKLPYPIRICKEEWREEVEREKYNLVKYREVASATIYNAIKNKPSKTAIYKYKVLSKICTGKRRLHYIEKYNKARN